MSRLRWQCRRGMRELDQLMTRYLELRYGEAGEDEKAAFRELLTLSDPELVGYLLKRERPTSEQLASVIEQLLSLPPP